MSKVRDRVPCYACGGSGRVVTTSTMEYREAKGDWIPSSPCHIPSSYHKSKSGPVAESVVEKAGLAEAIVRVNVLTAKVRAAWQKPRSFGDGSIIFGAAIHVRALGIWSTWSTRNPNNGVAAEV